MTMLELFEDAFKSGCRSKQDFRDFAWNTYKEHLIEIRVECLEVAAKGREANSAEFNPGGISYRNLKEWNV